MECVDRLTKRLIYKEITQKLFEKDRYRMLLAAKQRKFASLARMQSPSQKIQKSTQIDEPKGVGCPPQHQ
jgi:hypothetical protein